MSNTYLEQLGRLAGFTPAQLEANRQGSLHPAQLAKALRKRPVEAIVLTVLGFLVLGAGATGAYLYYDELGPEPSRSDLNAVFLIAAASAVLALVFVISAKRSLGRHRARKAAFVRGQPDVLEGPISKTHISGRGGIPSEYIFRMGGRSFHASEKLWELLTQGAHYRLYFVGGQLLSFEPAAAPGGSANPRVDDPVERAEYEREMEQQARTRHITPSRLVE